MWNKTLTLHTQDTTLAIGFKGEPLLMDVLQARGIAFAHPCGGRGVCKKCAVEAAGAVSSPNEAERQAGVRLSCQMRLLGDCEVTLKTVSGFGGQAGARAAGTLGLAADIGTTTLELRLYDLQTKAIAAQATALNPQAGFSADVIGRVTAALEGKGDLLRTRLLDTLQGMLAPYPPVTRAVLTGNTVMLYLLTGRSPRGLAAAPFTVDELFGKTKEIGGIPAYLPRCIGAFTGADLTCALLASGLTERPETALLCDVGTNGEIALWHAGRLLVASTAVGPAFEGAGISCGMGGVPGAVDKVWAAQNVPDVHVIGGGKPLGICGSGLIDAIAVLLRLRQIDDTGAIDAETVPLAEGLSLTRQDIRQVQLAKAAVAAGIETLLRAAGASARDVQTLYIAGGFGSHLDVRSAAAIGLIPRVLAPKARVLGNAALDGAALLLLEETQQKKADAIAQAAEIVQLSGNPLFADLFLAHMNF